MIERLLPPKSAKSKNDHGGEVFSPAREEEVLQNVILANKGPLDENTVRAIFREIMSGSRALQRIIKVAFWDRNTVLATWQPWNGFGQTVEFMRVGSIADVFEEVNRSHADFGVVPLENSTDGRVADTLEMFMRLPQLIICAEVRLRIHHNLLANCDQQDIADLQQTAGPFPVPQLAEQKTFPCLPARGGQHGHGRRTGQREPGAAAVASYQAAVRFGLRVLFTDIEDSPHNETRFCRHWHSGSPSNGQR